VSATSDHAKDCEWCRINKDVTAAHGSPAMEVVDKVYWSITCIRCGARVPYHGFDFAMCEPCNAILEEDP
jgi:hypothetical protein